MVKPAENHTENLQVMLVKWDMLCQIALECPAFQVCKLGSSGQGSDGLRFGPFWQQLMKMLHRNIQMLVYRFWDAYMNKCEIKLYVHQSFNPSLKIRAFCWKRNCLVKANCFPHKRSCFQSHKSIKKSGQNWGERLRTYFCGLLYYDFTMICHKLLPIYCQWYICEEIPITHQTAPRTSLRRGTPRSGLAWLAQQPTGANCTMLEAKSNPMMRERFDDTSDLSGSHCWRIPIPSRSQEQHPWRPSKGLKVNDSLTFLSNGSVLRSICICF